MFNVSDQYINHRCGLHLIDYQKLDPETKKLGIFDSKGKFTACHDHKHITREKYDEIIPKIIDEFVEAGFVKTEKHFEKDIDVLDIYVKLKKDNVAKCEN